MRFGSKSEQRDYAIHLLLMRIEEYILNNKDLCNKVFRISEQKDINLNNGLPLYRFDSYEIPVTTMHLDIPNHQEIQICPRKYKFKERIRILFKGE